MEQFKETIAAMALFLGIEVVYFKSGLVGGILSLAFDKKPSFWQGVAAVFGAAFAANYLTPLALEYTGFKSAGGVGCLIGLFFFRAIPIALFVIDNIPKKAGLFTLLKNVKSNRHDD